MGTAINHPVPDRLNPVFLPVLNYRDTGFVCFSFWLRVPVYSAFESTYTGTTGHNQLAPRQNQIIPGDGTQGKIGLAANVLNYFIVSYRIIIAVAVWH